MKHDRGRDKRRGLTILRREFLAGAAAAAPFWLLEAKARADVHPAPADAESGGLTPAEWAALRLAVLIMLPQPMEVGGPSVDDVVANLERFLKSADQTTFHELRQQLRVLGAVAPLADNHVPSLKRFAHEQLHQRGYSEVKNAFDSLHKVAVLGYYSHRKTYAKLDYHPIDVAPLYKTRLPVRAKPSARVFDVAIVGSGVAGSLLAERLSAARKSVVILESGPYVPEMDIDSDELTWFARLERGSGLQQANAAEPYVSSARSFPILQGHCVGGGGVINNAVCFQMPERRVTQWRGLGFPVSPEALRAGYRAVAVELGICPVSEAIDDPFHLNPSTRFLETMFGSPQRPSVSEPPAPGFYECLVNLERGKCLGCGLCNTGCGSERKRNALQVHLPKALGADRDCELVADARVDEIVLARGVAGAPHRVAELRVRRSSGCGEPFAVRAREYVLCAGAIHTPSLLLGSPDVHARSAALPIGERLSAHLVSPVLGFTTQAIHLRPTLQLTHYYIPPEPDEGFMIEDLYNPPGQAAVVMPGYGDTHFERMKKYKRTLLLGAVVPTLPNGRVQLDKDGRKVITQPLGESELRRLRNALALTARAMLRSRGDARASEVLIGVGGGGFPLRDEADVDGFARWLRGFDQLALSTGHPQGGTAMSDDPRIGAIDAEFRVRGFANLRVCDGSIFPMPAGVNPQWTIMALAHHCGNVINGTRTT